MNFSIKYKPLFSVKILHQYYLNKGEDDFFGMNSEESEKQLAGYDVSNFFKIRPTTESKLKLRNQRLFLKQGNAAFVLWSQVSETQDTVPFLPLNESLELNFLLTKVNSTFVNFTELGTSNSGRLYYFTNKRPDSEASSFPLIKKALNTNPVDATYQLSSKGTEEVLATLSADEKIQLFGIVSICIKGDNASLDITDNQNRIHEPAREFQIVFANRETFWRYFFEKDQQVKNKDDVKKENGSARHLVTKKAQPLTEKGFVHIELGDKELPNPDASVIKPDAADNKIYSEIYM